MTRTFAACPRHARFGPEYLTYVLWAITPEGRAVNLGEMIPNDDGNSRVQVTTGLQVFGLIVTAEPYFAVSRPGNLVVAENIVRNDTAGGIHPITAKFDLIEKGQYTQQLTPDQLPATTADKKVPLQLLEAENAIAIASAAGADTYAVDTLGKAKAFLAQGQDYYRRKQGITPIGAVARAATQSAEDARLLTIQRNSRKLPRRNGNEPRTAFRPHRPRPSNNQRGQRLPRKMPDNRLNSVR